ncbi:MAG: hypothetical protein BWK73_20190 [Thiothrix lacustris]|uniref:Uncharacterized protein n=1 Tax=Thiothrix lacustris TaxID=525917 RepID=A0A1Y1QP66_9GAMM|nr:MAG: hypothetical protein BWK73_20190 [Thiothrix lacustris]
MVDVTIKNPGYDEHIAASKAYHECEQERRNHAWLSSTVLAGLGLLVTMKYYDEYSDVVDERKRLNDKIYACAYKEHEHWRDRTYPHALTTFDWVNGLAEINPEYQEPTDAPPSLLHTALAWSEDGGCLQCDSQLQAYAVLADINSRTALARNQERRSEYRREFKASGMSAVDKAGKNLGAPGRQAMGVGLSMINTLVAMASTGMNSGMNMMGRGLADMGGSQWGGNT